MKMRLIVISASILIFAFGCANRGSGRRERVDPYVSMINSYMNELDNYDYSGVQEPPVPPSPAYVSAGNLSGPTGIYKADYSPTGSLRRPNNRNIDHRMGESVLRINEINNERRAAYDAALKKYKSVVERLAEEKGD